MKICTQCHGPRDSNHSWCKPCKAKDQRQRLNDVDYKERQLDAARRWRNNNRDQIQNYNKAYYQAHGARANQIRRARLLDQFVEDVDVHLLWEIYQGICGICHHPIDGPYHVDHIIPLSKGGPHCYMNCQVAHPSCNQRKSARLPVEEAVALPLQAAIALRHVLDNHCAEQSTEILKAISSEIKRLRQRDAIDVEVENNIRTLPQTT